MTVSGAGAVTVLHVITAQREDTVLRVTDTPRVESLAKVASLSRKLTPWVENEWHVKETQGVWKKLGSKAARRMTPRERR